MRWLSLNHSPTDSAVHSVHTPATREVGLRKIFDEFDDTLAVSGIGFTRTLAVAVHLRSRARHSTRVSGYQQSLKTREIISCPVPSPSLPPSLPPSLSLSVSLVRMPPRDLAVSVST